MSETKENERIWTLSEANAALFQVEALVRQGRVVLHEMQTARSNLDDLKIIWGHQLLDESCGAHHEYMHYRTIYDDARARLDVIQGRFAAVGCDVQDLGFGVIDFHAQMGNEEVCLCWTSGTPRIAHWHAVDEEFSSRRPIPSTYLDALRT